MFHLIGHVAAPGAKSAVFDCILISSFSNSVSYPRRDGKWVPARVGNFWSCPAKSKALSVTAALYAAKKSITAPQRHCFNGRQCCRLDRVTLYCSLWKIRHMCCGFLSKLSHHLLCLCRFCSLPLWIELSWFSCPYFTPNLLTVFPRSLDAVYLFLSFSCLYALKHQSVSLIYCSVYRTGVRWINYQSCRL